MEADGEERPAEDAEPAVAHEDAGVQPARQAVAQMLDAFPIHHAAGSDGERHLGTATHVE